MTRMLIFFAFWSKGMKNMWFCAPFKRILEVLTRNNLCWITITIFLKANHLDVMLMEVPMHLYN